MAILQGVASTLLLNFQFEENLRIKNCSEAMWVTQLYQSRVAQLTKPKLNKNTLCVRTHILSKTAGLSTHAFSLSFTAVRNTFVDQRYFKIFHIKSIHQPNRILPGRRRKSFCQHLIFQVLVKSEGRKHMENHLTKSRQILYQTLVNVTMQWYTEWLWQWDNLTVGFARYFQTDWDWCKSTPKSKQQLCWFWVCLSCWC